MKILLRNRLAIAQLLRKLGFNEATGKDGVDAVVFREKHPMSAAYILVGMENRCLRTGDGIEPFVGVQHVEDGIQQFRLRDGFYQVGTNVQLPD
jgi:hypothetical protein